MVNNGQDFALMWHFLHVKGPVLRPAIFISLWHLLHSLFITCFFFNFPCALSSLILPGFCGNTEWHILQSTILSWCWRWGNGTLPLVPPSISMFSAPLFWSLSEKATDEAMTIAANDINTTLSLIFKKSCPLASYLTANPWPGRAGIENWILVDVACAAQAPRVAPSFFKMERIPHWVGFYLSGYFCPQINARGLIRGDKAYALEH